MKFNSKKGSQEDHNTEDKMTCFTEISSLMITISIVIILTYPFLQSCPPTEATKSSNSNHDPLFNYRQSPHFKNSAKCEIFPTISIRSKICNPSLVHISMTLDTKFLRGSVAAIHSILQHSHCPENLFFHFISSESINLEPYMGKIFPSLAFKIYYFNPGIVQNKISSTIREALEHPLNYARNYLAELLEPCVERVIYLDSDIILVDDISNLWKTSLGSRTVGSPEYCNANFTNYFTPKFWSHKKFFRVFRGRRPCYFNTGVMVIDLSKWRKYRYTRKLERWMKIQRVHRIYELGSLPPFLLVFGGKISSIHQKWNQHGLGGDNLSGSCRNIHGGPVSLLHWSGGGKPWLRLDSGNSCPLDEIWARYDLHAPPM
ncbi:PREDICTED: probable galacturonosyltransferase-like 6 [Nicotiana attenuata]|uniref:Hexosyltransferase n=1 Tax=Nicotiana attenuata TaxID=49451 RepID=A0A1J6J9U2_NICAT|nr:PREDICTED: probable galacturonosyltransferase-like 6 [Nicotiana attenuata]OIT07587.1 putative galacturonosyltransferase-like 7 [Nicotiana attenuata]